MSTSKPDQPKAKAKDKPANEKKPKGLHVGGVVVHLTAGPDGKTLELRGLTDPLILSLEDARVFSRFLSEAAAKHDVSIIQNRRTDEVVAEYLDRVRSAWLARSDQGGPDAVLELREVQGTGTFEIAFRDRAEAAALLVKDWKVPSDKVKAGGKTDRPITVVVVTTRFVAVRHLATGEAVEPAATPEPKA